MELHRAETRSELQVVVAGLQGRFDRGSSGVHRTRLAHVSARRRLALHLRTIRAQFIVRVLVLQQIADEEENEKDRSEPLSQSGRLRSKKSAESDEQQDNADSEKKPVNVRSGDAHIFASILRTLLFTRLSCFGKISPIIALLFRPVLPIQDKEDT